MNTLMAQKKEEFLFDRRIRNSGFDMTSSHYHNHYELYYLLSGQSRIFINHTLYYLEAGMAVLIRPMEIHRTTYRLAHGALNQNDRIAINFSPGYLEEMVTVCGEAETKNLLSQRHMIVPAARKPYIEELFLKIGFEDSREDPYSGMLKKHHLYELLVLLGRMGKEEELRQKIGDGEQAIEEAAQYIYHNYYRQMTLEEVADRAHLSPTYFSRKFKKVTGFGYKEYLNNVRIKKGAERLLNTEESVTQIALECGFSDGNYFGDAFRKAKGMSPNQYRKNPEVH